MLSMEIYRGSGPASKLSCIHSAYVRRGRVIKNS